MRGGMTPVSAKHPFQSLKRVLPWIMPYWPVMLFGLACMLITTYLGQQPPRIIQHIIDDVLGSGGGFYQGVRAVLLLGAVYLGSMLFNMLRTYWLHVAGQKVIHNLRVRLYGHFQQLPLTYYDNRQTGDLMSRMTGDVEQIENLMVHGLDVLVMGILGMGLAWYYIHVYAPLISWLVLIPVPILLIAIYFFSGRVRKIYRTIRDRVGDLNAKLQDNISGIRVIKAFSRETDELDRVTADSEQVREMSIRGIRMWATFGPLMGLIGNISTLTALLVGIYLVSIGEIKAGAVMAIFLYTGNFYQPIGQLFQFFDSIQRSLAAGERILEVMDTIPEIQDPEAPKTLDAVAGHVELRDVSFSYASGERVLHEISLTAEPGQRIALVGRSGAGKTSFINLIPRFYDPLEGAVFIEGTDVRDLRQAELRRYIALVLQETFLFNGSVAENLRYGKLGAGDEELEAAARIANAHEFIEKLPDGYATEIGERGVKLSGGQRQRLAIARAVLADPRILILDEATSSVDSESEILIHQALERLMEGRTTFIIAHRLSTIRSADVILVLENGRIVERGPHRELIKARGLYAHMYEQQFWLDDIADEEEEAEERDIIVEPDIDLPAMQ
ncbi:MAG: putative ABC transporter ATP-binding protein [bacterium ADurb.Bin429]|nr:MAG: putative ABC transporter ATP-binding protein [bacterium ADurb.Bin429]